MTNETEIITVREVETHALKTSTFDSALLEDFIIPAQRQYLKKFIGKDYYNDLISKIDADTLTADDVSLLEDYLRPMLSYYIVYDAFPSIQMNITSAGIIKNSTDSSEAASSSEASTLRANMLRMAEVWREHARDFVKEAQDDDSTKYPLFDTCEDTNTNKYGFIF